MAALGSVLWSLSGEICIIWEVEYLWKNTQSLQNEISLLEVQEIKGLRKDYFLPTNGCCYSQPALRVSVLYMEQLWGYYRGDGEC